MTAILMLLVVHATRWCGIPGGKTPMLHKLTIRDCVNNHTLIGCIQRIRRCCICVGTPTTRNLNITTFCWNILPILTPNAGIASVLTISDRNLLIIVIRVLERKFQIWHTVCCHFFENPYSTMKNSLGTQKPRILVSDLAFKTNLSMLANTSTLST